MRFFTTAVSVALAAFAALTSAQASTKANAITAPISGASVDAGDSFTITWMNIVGSKVNLDLMDGPVNGLKVIKSIAVGIDNTGSYKWSVPTDVPTAQTYTIRISYDSNPNNYNYSDRFLIMSSFVATASSTSAGTSTTSAASTSTETTSEASTTSAPSTSAGTTTNSTTSASTMGTSSTRRSSSSGSSSTAEPTSTGAPPSAGSTTLSSPLAVIMAVLAAALFIH